MTTRALSRTSVILCRYMKTFRTKQTKGRFWNNCRSWAPMKVLLLFVYHFLFFFFVFVFRYLRLDPDEVINAKRIKVEAVSFYLFFSCFQNRCPNDFITRLNCLKLVETRRHLFIWFCETTFLTGNVGQWYSRATNVARIRFGTRCRHLCLWVEFLSSPLCLSETGLPPSGTNFSRSGKVGEFLNKSGKFFNIFKVDEISGKFF